MISPRNSKRLCIICVLTVLNLSACQKPTVVTRVSSPSTDIDVLLVLPFKDMTNLYGENVTLRSPLSGRTYTTGKVSRGADDFLMQLLMSNLQLRGGLQLIPWGQAEGVWGELLAKETIEQSEREMILATGRELNADAVLAGYVYRFVDRTGTQYSVETPASVGFDLDLIRIQDGRLVWSRRFDETQKTLSDDIMQINKFIKRKGRWITARDMAASGLEDMLHTLPVP